LLKFPIFRLEKYEEMSENSSVPKEMAKCPEAIGNMLENVVSSPTTSQLVSLFFRQ